jgi:hypothetical protein
MQDRLRHRLASITSGRYELPVSYFAINQSGDPLYLDNLVTTSYRNALKKVGCNGRYQLEIGIVEEDIMSLDWDPTDPPFRLVPPFKLNRMPDDKYPRGGDQDFTEPAVITDMLRDALIDSFNVYNNSVMLIDTMDNDFIREGLRQGLKDTIYKREHQLINSYLPSWNGLEIEPYRVEMAMDISIYHIKHNKETSTTTVIYDCLINPDLMATMDPNPPVSLSMLFG